MDGVDHRDVGLADDVLVAVELVDCGRLELRLGDGDRLVLILEVGMRHKLSSLVRDGLERDELVGCLVGAGVERELDVHVAFLVLGRKFLLGGDGVAVGVDDRLSGLLVHERAGDLVGLAGGHALVMNGIDDQGVGLADDVLVAVELVDGGRLELGLGDGDRLVLVLEVGVNAYFDALVGH